MCGGIPAAGGTKALTCPFAGLVHLHLHPHTVILAAAPASHSIQPLPVLHVAGDSREVRSARKARDHLPWPTKTPRWIGVPCPNSRRPPTSLAHQSSTKPEDCLELDGQSSSLSRALLHHILSSPIYSLGAQHGLNFLLLSFPSSPPPSSPASNPSPLCHISTILPPSHSSFSRDTVLLATTPVLRYHHTCQVLSATGSHLADLVLPANLE